MTNKLARIAALALTFAAVSPVLPSVARACGGYGSQSATPSRAVYRYVYALRTNAPALASEM